MADRSLTLTDAQLQAERWLPVVGFEGLYEVSDMGRVRSVDRVLPYARKDQYSGKMLAIERVRKGQILKAGPHASGHLSVVLGRRKTRMVQRLVLDAFVGPCPPKHESLHWNDDPSDNTLPNLRWGTRGQNLLDAVRNGKKRVGENHPHAKLTNDQVRAIRRRLKLPLQWGDLTRIAKSYGVAPVVISDLRDGKSWQSIK